MRMLLKICLIGLGAITLAVVVGLTWFFFYSRGLPDALALAQFAPATVRDKNRFESADGRVATVATRTKKNK